MLIQTISQEFRFKKGPIHFLLKKYELYDPCKHDYGFVV
jgi:hypothetical protein